MQINVKHLFCRALQIVFEKKCRIPGAGDLSLHNVPTLPSPSLLLHSSPPSLPVSFDAFQVHQHKKSGPTAGEKCNLSIINPLMLLSKPLHLDILQPSSGQTITQPIKNVIGLTERNWDNCPKKRSKLACANCTAVGIPVSSGISTWSCF